VSRSDFQTIWTPRIGEEATRALRSYRHASLIPLGMCVLAGAAGLVFGGGSLDNFLGVVLVVATVGLFVVYIRRKGRLATALSLWFGTKIRSGELPVMNPGRFDTWCEKRGLRRPGESAGELSAQSPDVVP
jgi:hypothetical protein